MKKKIAPRTPMVRSFSTRPLPQRTTPLCDLLELIVEALYTRVDMRSIPNSSRSIAIVLEPCERRPQDCWDVRFDAVLCISTTTGRSLLDRTHNRNFNTECAMLSLDVSWLFTTYITCFFPAFAAPPNLLGDSWFPKAFGVFSKISFTRWCE